MADTAQEPVSHATFGPIVVARFNVAPTVDTAVTLIRVTEAATRDHQKISFVGIVPDRMLMPSPEFRKVLIEQGATIKKNAFSLHFAIEGIGILASLQRAMLSAIASGFSIGMPFSIHSSGEDALLEVGRLRPDMSSTVIGEALRLGLIRPAPSKPSP